MGTSVSASRQYFQGGIRDFPVGDSTQTITFPPSIQQNPDTCVHNADDNGDRYRLFDTDRDRNANGRTSVKGCLGLIFLLDGGRLSVGARRVA